MVILDTDTVTRLHGNHPGVAQRLRGCTDPDVKTTIITRIEILRGRFEAVMKADSTEQFLRAQTLLSRTEMQLELLPILPLDQASLTQFQAVTRVKGVRRIGRPDLLIAAIALAHDATLVTRNLRHFRLIPGLLLENWVD
jgi:tRNA(fMet)-specific endonuclease VapC